MYVYGDGGVFIVDHAIHPLVIGFGLCAMFYSVDSLKTGQVASSSTFRVFMVESVIRIANELF